MSEPGKYVYCIVRCTEDRSFDDVSPIGGGTSEVHTVRCGDLAAVVSDCALSQYESTRVNMLAHEKVQERVMQEFFLLPVRFGTVANSGSSVDAITSLLRDRQQEFHGLLADIAGKSELGLKALWKDEKIAFQEMLSERQDIKRLRDSIAGRPPAATHFERIQLGEMVKEALDQKRAAEAESIMARLRPISVATVENKILMDRMIANAAFLVETKREKEFDSAVSRLDADMGAKVQFKYVGPVPPYNFVNIIVNWNKEEGA
ncbi:MAG: GvpL/GvpF family gas vesicle protein [Chloroflexi bacterium]|nr:GvpL/GvpF family gas vesicle protein [Chloroflexota bacterium]